MMKKVYLVSASIIFSCLACLTMVFADNQIGEPYQEDTTAYKADSMGAIVGI
jgi:hypothetical protein